MSIHASLHPRLHHAGIPHLHSGLAQTCVQTHFAGSLLQHPARALAARLVLGRRIADREFLTVEIATLAGSVSPAFNARIASQNRP